MSNLPDKSVKAELARYKAIVELANKINSQFIIMKSIAQKKTINVNDRFKLADAKDMLQVYLQELTNALPIPESEESDG